MTRTRHRMHLLGGLLLAPAAWAVNTQLGRVLPEADCSSGWRLSLLASLAFAATALAGSGFARSLASHQPLGGPRPETRSFLSRLAILAAILFAFALLLQGAASMILTGCEP